MTISPLRRFVLAAVLWLPMAFFLWAVLASAVIWPVAHLADVVLPLLLPDAISGVVHAGPVIEVETQLVTEAGPGGQQGMLVLDVRPLIYAWCLPLFFGLSMATPLTARRRWLQLGIGLPVLWLVSAWGAVFDTLKLLAFDAGPLGAAAISSAGFPLDGIALGYQFGYLILPAVTPVTLWVVMNRQFLETLVGWRAEPDDAGDGPTPPPPADPPSGPHA